MDSRSRSFLPAALSAAILAVSTASIFIRFAQNGSASSLTIAALRLTFAVLLIAPLALTRHWIELKRLSQAEILLAVFSGAFLAVHFVAWITSLEYTSVASSVVFVSTGPLWVALLSPALLKERLSRSALAGLALALAGGIVIALFDARGSLGARLSGRAMWGNFLALVGAWAVSGYLILGRKLRASMSLIPYVFLVYGAAAVMLLLTMTAAGDSPFGLAPRTYLWIFLLAALPQVVGHSIYNWALKRLSAALVAATTLGEPIGSAFLAYFILQETPSSTTLFGGALILVGIYLAAKSR